MDLRKKHDRFLTNGRSLGLKGQTLSTRLVTTVTLHSRISMNRNGLQLPIVRFCVSLPAECRDRRVGKFLAMDAVCDLTDC